MPFRYALPHVNDFQLLRELTNPFKDKSQQYNNVFLLG
jgi:hypothetical protein